MKSTIYYLSGFNNYYNRQIKLPESVLVSDYNDFIVLDQIGVNFNPNDGIDTYLDVNYNTLDDTKELDYILVSEDNQTINSRWFVINRTRNLSGQWRLTFRRDLIADYYQSVIESPVFLEKATISSIANKFIFNKENGINYNQIKTGESLLKDETDSGWIVGYIADNHSEVSISVTSANEEYPEPPIDLATLRTYSRGWTTYTGSGYPYINYLGDRVPTSAQDSYQTWSITMYNNGTIASKTSTNTAGPNYNFTFNRVGTIDQAANNLSAQVAQRATQILNNVIDYAKTKISGTYFESNTLATLQSMSGGTYTDNGQTFKVTVRPFQLINNVWDIGTSAGALYNTLLEVWEASDCGTKTSFYKDPIRVYYSQQVYTVDIEEIAAAATTTIKTSVSKLQDAPYKMFCIPYGAIKVTYTTSGSTFINNENVAKRAASRLATQFGSQLYDLQLLPYCPFRSIIDSGGIDVQTLTSDVAYTLINLEASSPASIILWPTSSNFSFTINHTIEVPSTAIDFKIDHETKFVRLCSPNYSGSFEFKPTSNYGVSQFEVNCTYKPFSPYIHVCPLFNEGSLYGGDFNDQRGLVCTGDFSLPIANDSWIQYQINNKSYEDSFKRQIENMETTYSINRKQMQAAGVIGAVTAGIGGIASGSMIGGFGGLGGPIGAGIGAVVGGAGGAIASAVGLNYDLKYADQLQAEALSYAKDQFGYQMQNVQALPYTIGKVSAFSINNKIFPFIEFFDCTEAEKEMLRYKLTYNGMTVMTTSTIDQYLNIEEPTFIQGQLIRFINTNSDYHTAAEIASELHKGVYI